MTLIYKEDCVVKRIAVIGILMVCSMGTAVADGYGFVYNYGYAPRYYDRVDAMADREIAEINAQEQAEIMHELREGDYREVQQVIQRDEAIKNEIRREEAMYDNARDMSRFNYGYGGYYDNSGW
jgi:hypothetical protein